ncbi:hypothetical protein [Clostridium sp.]|uniref:hypothetical protein n=1 Tax=Clostridium sp. TaxID=1506 RepID=UPI00290C3E5B|nr:hypothetical protein [Clostridium sp.]MDU6522146.1 hypothetical protein [Clostridium sp.]
MYVKKDILKLRSLLLSCIGEEIIIRKDKSGKGIYIKEIRYLLCDVNNNFIVVKKIENGQKYIETYSFNSILSEGFTVFLNNKEELKLLLKKNA